MLSLDVERDEGQWKGRMTRGSGAEVTVRPSRVGEGALASERLFSARASGSRPQPLSQEEKGNELIEAACERAEGQDIRGDQEAPLL